MRIRTIATGLAVILLAVNFASAKDSPDKKRDKTRKMADKTLQQLYKLKPTAQAAIKKSAGYAVFDNFGTNLFVLSTARGSGIAVDTSSKQETFMKMVSAGAGLGVAIAMELARRMGGAMRLAGESGHGATMELRLPKL